FMVETYDSYGDDLSVMLLDKIPKKTVPYLVVAPKYRDRVKREDKKVLTPIGFEERVEVLDYLCENRERVEFDPGELLYYAILFGDKPMTAELEKRGAEFSDYRKKMLTDKGERKDLFIWTGLLENLSEEEFVPVLSQITRRLEGAKLHCTDGIYFACRDKLLKADNLKFYFENFDKPKINKIGIMTEAVDKNRVECLEFAAENGWLKQPKKRDELIEYSHKKGKTECTAWLLDFKNRTADLAAERAKAEKQTERELNAAPDSVTALKPLWSWKKRENGGLVITGYKGNKTEVSVPEKIGKDTVTALGMAFSPASRVTKEIADFRQTITRVTLPETITEICDEAFLVCLALESVNIPKSVVRIGIGAFGFCRALRGIDIPDGVTEISANTFHNCDSLESVSIPESVQKIDGGAFWDCSSLERIVIPRGVTEIGPSAFAGCKKLKAIEFPETLAELPYHMLDGCFELKYVAIPKGITAIRGYVFYNCRKLTRIEIPDSVSEIGEFAFARCASLETIVIPEGVREIGGRAFADDPNLKRVELPRSLAKAVNITSKGNPPITIFDNSPNVTAVVYPKSYAERYCK
ncbi:MAG: leucine-rich repeat domain-containing protein, partial [Oscillospiraceae bacterium]|nr:leucine-rich repeat domain-containing protein [Oscillospiraceae bacterium]